jgi:predicted ester cyclase
MNSKTFFGDFRAALYDCDPQQLRQQLHALCSADCDIRLAHPMGVVRGPDELLDVGYAPLLDAIPDLERRDYIVVGAVERGEDWIGCGGYYTGVFEKPWLEIPPTQHLVTMRYIEFFRIEGSKIVEMRLLWDIPEIMMQSSAWPMPPSLGVDFHIPGPATGDGIVNTPYDPEQSAASMRLVLDMLDGLSRHATGGSEAMHLERYWHPKMNWYGPSGIGTARGIDGFRNWHQIPFLNAMPDRGQYVGEIDYHFFGEREYAAVTGWPDMIQTLDHGGWLGIAPVDKRIEMRSLDFWRIENGLIRENWVMVDLLHMYHQIGVDVFSRLREFNKARPFRLTPIS